LPDFVTNNQSPHQYCYSSSGCGNIFDNFDFFIEKTDEKTKVKSKSYYTEEGTEKMIGKFLEKY